MRQRGQHRVGARADAVWLALSDPEVLAQCIPGCQAITRIGDDAFTAAVRASVGDFTGLFTAEIAVSDLDPPHAYTLEVSVKAGAAGSGKGSARISLIEEDGDTLVLHEVEGRLAGRLAHIDRRATGAWARGTVDDFFAKFSEIVAPGRTASAGGAAERAAAGRASVFAVVLAVATLLVLLRRRSPSPGRKSRRPRSGVEDLLAPG
jgi:uncharacterized protein